MIFHNAKPCKSTPYTKQGEKALIKGYYGYKNIGDEAALHVLITLLKNKRIKPIIATKNIEYTKRIHDVDAVYSGINLSFLKAFLYADIFIIGPGNKHGFMNVIDLGLPVLAKLLRKRVQYVGVGLNPHKWKDIPLIKFEQVKRYANPIKRAIVKFLFNNFVDIAFLRDYASREFLIKNGVKAQIKVIKDLAYFLDPAPREIVKSVVTSKGVDVERDKLIGITIRRFKDIHVNTYFRKQLSKILAKIYQMDHAVKFVFVPFSARGYDNDIEYAGEIKESLLQRGIPLERIVIIETDDPRVIKGIICYYCRLIIGVRYHSCVFADACRVPFVSIIYDPKSEVVSNSALLKCSVYDIRAKDIVDTILSIL